MKITVRPAVTDDIDILVEMLNSLFTIEDDFSPDPLKQRAGLDIIVSGKTGGAVFLAEYDGSPAGMVNLQKIVSTAAGGFSVLLEDLYVVPEMRRNGVGTVLLQEAIRWGREEGSLRIQLGADVRNKPAISFYTAKGFKISNLALHYKSI